MTQGFDFQRGTIQYEEFVEFFDGLSILEPSDEKFFMLVNECFA